MKNLLKIFALIAKNLSKMGITLKEVDILKFSSTGFSSLMGFLDEPEYQDYLFLPFKDETNGKDTYGGGRYLDLRIPQNDELIIDFNKAYHPFCAYNVS